MFWVFKRRGERWCWVEWECPQLCVHPTRWGKLHSSVRIYYFVCGTDFFLHLQTVDPYGSITKYLMHYDKTTDWIHIFSGISKRINYDWKPHSYLLLSFTNSGSNVFMGHWKHCFEWNEICCQCELCVLPIAKKKATLTPKTELIIFSTLQTEANRGILNDFLLMSSIIVILL